MRSKKRQNLNQMLIPYFLLSLSLLGLSFFEKIWVGLTPFVLAVVSALYLKRLDPISLVSMTGFFLLFFLNKKFAENSWIQITTFVAIIAMSYAFFIHAVPGFNNLQLLNKIQISSDSTPYSLWLNFDKTLIAIGGLLFLSQTAILTHKESLKVFGLFFIASVIVLLLLSFILGYIRLDPKIPKFIFLWSFKVLLFTCFAEEFLFRGLIWKLAESLTSNQTLILSFTALLFGLAHYQGGWKYVLLSSAAGLLYGGIYLSTGRIGYSILLHFGVNLTHILLFSYPAKVQGN